jgi:hypothetical protein
MKAKQKQRWARFTDSEHEVIEGIDNKWPQCLTKTAWNPDGSLWGLAHEVREFRASQNTSGADDAS